MHLAIYIGIGVLVAGLILLIIFEIHSHRRPPLPQAQSQDLFNESADRVGLTTEEREKLLSLLSYQKALDPNTIFQSLPLFERCIDAEVGRLQKSDKAVAADGPEEKLLSEIRRKLGFSYIPLEHPLVSTRNIAIGQVGSLFGKEGNKAIFNKVSVVGNNNFFLTVQYDVEGEDRSRAVSDTEVRFVFARQSDGLYGVQVKVANSKEPGVLDLLHTLDIRRNQLRQYVRVPTDLSLRFRLLTTKNPDKSEILRGHLITTRMCDISGGGLSFKHNQALRLGDLIGISFDLPGQMLSGITGKIVHLSLQEDKEGHQFKHHVQFVTIEQGQRDDIIRYVTEKERQS
ncbi:MAG TPA: PilZ domain-containing protein [Chitinivibrionales bacterium]|nr:PilZ domain-containing protein [Chitinivibrionales bacterium]